ncbi:MAG: SRPBCC family protein [Phyllobacterium sp.]
MSERSVYHSTFVIERMLDAPVAQVFAAFSDPEIHDRWFVKADGWPIAEYTHDFRVGGRESGRFSRGGKKIYFNETIYLDIVKDKRIAFAYSMADEEACFSASVATVELLRSGSGTKLIFTEQGAFFDGRDQPADREAGWTSILNALEAELNRQEQVA